MARASRQLEDHFQSRLLVDIGNVTAIGVYAEQLRLHITQEECSVVLDYVAETQIVLVTRDHVETVINELFEDRFLEP